MNIFTVAGKESSGKLGEQQPAEKSKLKIRKSRKRAIQMKAKHYKTEITQRKSVMSESECEESELSVFVNVDVHAEMNAYGYDAHKIESPTLSQITIFSKRLKRETPEQKRISDDIFAIEDDVDWKTVSKYVDQQSTTYYRLSQTSDKSICESFTECKEDTQNGLISSSSGLCTETNSTKENDKHSNSGQQNSTAQEIRIRPMADGGTAAPLDPYYFDECEGEEIVEICIENESFDGAKYDDSYLTTSEKKYNVEFPPRTRAIELCTDADVFVCNTQG